MKSIDPAQDTLSVTNNMNVTETQIDQIEQAPINSNANVSQE